MGEREPCLRQGLCEGMCVASKRPPPPTSFPYPRSHCMARPVATSQTKAYRRIVQDLHRTADLPAFPVEDGYLASLQRRLTLASKIDITGWPSPPTSAMSGSLAVPVRRISHLGWLCFAMAFLSFSDALTSTTLEPNPNNNGPHAPSLTRLVPPSLNPFSDFVQPPTLFVPRVPISLTGPCCCRSAGAAVARRAVMAGADGARA